jgi:hypothetical protein
MKTPSPMNHHRRAPHPNASQTPRTAIPHLGKATLIRFAHPGKHSAPVKPPAMLTALATSSLVPALLPRSATLTNLMMPKAKATSTPLPPTAQGWALGSARPPRTGPGLPGSPPKTAPARQPPRMRQSAPGAGPTSPRERLQPMQNQTPHDGKSGYQIPLRTDTHVSRKRNLRPSGCLQSDAQLRHLVGHVASRLPPRSRPRFR